jgi:hypothetical protein
MARILAASLLCIGFLIVVAIPNRAQARLGGSVESIETDRKSFSAVQRSVTSDAAYTVHTIDNGATVIREYASPEGVVFAIVWEGTRTPDLPTLLGSYFGQYNQALADTPRAPGARHLSVQADDVVVQKWGQVGSVRGRAYAPALIPNGVSIDEIK